MDLVCGLMRRCGGSLPPHLDLGWRPASWALGIVFDLAGMIVLAMIVGVIESSMARLRLVRIPPGRFRRLHRRNWKETRRERKQRERAERKYWNEREKAEPAAWKEGKGKRRGHDRDD